MADNETRDLLNLLRKRLDGAEPDVLRDMVQLMAEGLMSAEADQLCGAPYGVRSDEDGSSGPRIAALAAPGVPQLPAPNRGRELWHSIGVSATAGLPRFEHFRRPAPPNPLHRPAWSDTTARPESGTRVVALHRPTSASPPPQGDHDSSTSAALRHPTLSIAPPSMTPRRPGNVLASPPR